jgi:hypothetical protein
MDTSLVKIHNKLIFSKMKTLFKNQKRLFGLIALASVLLISFTGCEEKDDDDEDVPGMVLNFTVFPGEGEVDVDWDAPSDEDGTGGVKGYELTKDNWKTKETKKADERSHKFKGLKNDEEYEFKIRAYNSKGRGRESSAKATPSEFANRDPNLDPRTYIYSGKIVYKSYNDDGTFSYRTFVFDAERFRKAWMIDAGDGSGGTGEATTCNGNHFFWQHDEKGGAYLECKHSGTCYKANYSFPTGPGQTPHTKRLPGFRLIAGRQCTIAIDDRGEEYGSVAFYRGIIFMESSDGKIQKEVISFSEGVSNGDFSPPSGYMKAEAEVNDYYCYHYEMNL